MIPHYKYPGDVVNAFCQLIAIFLFLKSNKSTWTREIITNHTLKTNSNLYPPKTKQVQNNPHGHPHRAVDRPKIRGSLRRQGKRKKAFFTFSPLLSNFEVGYLYFSKVYCSDILDAITKDFFARKGGAMDETTHVTDIQVQDKIRKKNIPPPQVATFADRPGYERTSSSLWKQREEYCAALIQKAWKDHQVNCPCSV